MKSLDRSKPFAQVVGASDNTAFIQDNISFDGSGNQILTPGEAQAEHDRAAAAELEAKKPVLAHAALLALSVDKVKAELGDLNLEVLHAVRAEEEAGANRVTLLAAIDAEIAAKDELAKQLG